jgi:DNA helicase-2/ATP-dependent DNA helicase PcrA
MMRLAVDANDNLAWRTLLDVRVNRIGKKAIAAIATDATTENSTFTQALLKRAESEGVLKTEFTNLNMILAKVKAVVGDAKAVLTPEQVKESLAAISKILEDAGVTGLDEANAHVLSVAEMGDADSFDTLLSSLSLASFTDQERAEGAVNMLSMHKAKGLSARAVIVMACEDEYLPGRQQSGNEEADERRLLYVSLTRAKQNLFVTYAQKRTGPQQHTGRDSGKMKRSLTRYLRNAPIHPIAAEDFFHALGT